jgi:hypothetical protein
MKTKLDRFISVLAKICRGILICIVVACLIGGIYACYSEYNSKVSRSIKGAQASCNSNLRQMGLGMAEYAQDYNNCYPPTGHWAAAIYPYIKATGVFQCPADPNQPHNKTYPLSYAMNSNAQGLDINSNPDRSMTVLLCEYASFNVDMTNPNDKAIYPKTDGVSKTPIGTWGNLMQLGVESAPSTTRHDPRLMFLTLDGHVKFLKPEQASGGENAVSKTSIDPSHLHAAGSEALGTKYKLTFSAK